MATTDPAALFVEGAAELTRVIHVPHGSQHRIIREDMEGITFLTIATPDGMYLRIGLTAEQLAELVNA